MRSWALAGIFVCMGALASLAGCEGGDTGGGDGGTGGGGLTCNAGQTECSGACTDLTVDPSNCGACGTLCDTAGGEVCNAGVCEVVVTGCDGAMPDPALCGDSMTGCIACSLGTPNADGGCAEQLAACQNDMECSMDYVPCIMACAPGDATCFMTCDTMFPAGSALYNEIALCVLCDACFVVCDGANSGCP